MPKEEPTKKVRPRSPEELLALEDRLASISQKLRDIRKGMADAEMPTVVLGIGTFEHFTGKLEELVERYAGSFRSQQIADHVRRTRERIRQDMASGKRKDLRR